MQPFLKKVTPSFPATTLWELRSCWAPTLVGGSTLPSTTTRRKQQKVGCTLWYRCFPVMYCEYFKRNFLTDHIQVLLSGSWIWKHFPVLTKLLFKRRITKQLLWRLTKTCFSDSYWLAGNGPLMRKTFYLVNFVLLVFFVFLSRKLCGFVLSRWCCKIYC